MLSPDKKRKVLDSINVLNLDKYILPFVQDGSITVDELKRARIENDRLNYILARLETVPPVPPEIPEHESKPELKPEPKPETKPETEPEPKPEPKPESKPEPKPEPKPELKPEHKPETKPEHKPETKPEPKPIDNGPFADAHRTPAPYAPAAFGHTDVYFLGIPASGKTSVLMGLLASQLTASAVPFAEKLADYPRLNEWMRRSPNGYVKPISTNIMEATGASCKRVNFMELSGNDIYYGMADYKGNPCAVKDMCPILESLLSNDNRKVFFLVVDAKAIASDSNGECTVSPLTPSQSEFMKRVVDTFALPANAPLMNKVEAIHVLMTKTDILADDDMRRRDLAVGLFNSHMKDSVFNPLVQICRKYGINSRSARKHHPYLFAFSMGTVNPDGRYTYDPLDSDNLVKCICRSIP